MHMSFLVSESSEILPKLIFGNIQYYIERDRKIRVVFQVVEVIILFEFRTLIGKVWFRRRARRAQGDSNVKRCIRAPRTHHLGLNKCRVIGETQFIPDLSSFFFFEVVGVPRFFREFLEAQNSNCYIAGKSFEFLLLKTKKEETSI